MTPATVVAFSNEMRKIAAGPVILSLGKMDLKKGRTSGMYIPMENIDVSAKDLAQMKRHGHSLEGMIALPTHKAEARYFRGMGRKKFARLAKQHPDAVGQSRRATLRHELTHWLRDRKGKMRHGGEPNLRGVLTTAREEFIANRMGSKRLTNPLAKKMTGSGLRTTLRSVAGKYGGTKNVLKAMLRLR